MRQNDVPHLRVPFEVDSQCCPLTVQQDSDRELRQAVEVTLGTLAGERQVVPAFGLPDPVWRSDDPAEDAAELVREWDDRIGVRLVETIVEQWPGGWGVDFRYGRSG